MILSKPYYEHKNIEFHNEYVSFWKTYELPISFVEDLFQILKFGSIFTSSSSFSFSTLFYIMIDCRLILSHIYKWIKTHF